MTAQVLTVFTHYANAVEVATQDYELAKEHVEKVLLNGDHRHPEHRYRFHAAIQRRQEARERWLRAMTL